MPPLQVTVEPLPPLADVERRWRELEARSRASVFLSWLWIGTWLRRLCPLSRARLLSVHANGELVALGVVVEQRRWFALGLKHVRLHETGDAVVGYLYHLAWRVVAYFYQAGIGSRCIGRPATRTTRLVSDSAAQ